MIRAFCIALGVGVLYAFLLGSYVAIHALLAGTDVSGQFFLTVLVALASLALVWGIATALLSHLVASLLHSRFHQSRYIASVGAGVCGAVLASLLVVLLKDAMQEPLFLVLLCTAALGASISLVSRLLAVPRDRP
jgi:uncharacterized membrane protein YeaQ/YmgE (transglycosylase-associated protein family)